MHFFSFKGGLEKYAVQVSTNSVGYYESNRENPLIQSFWSGSIRQGLGLWTGLADTGVKKICTRQFSTNLDKLNAKMWEIKWTFICHPQKLNIFTFSICKLA